MSAEILLVRHGRVPKNDVKDIIHGRSSDEPLTELGVVQSEAHGGWLRMRRAGIVKVLSSTAVRAMMTGRHSLTAADIDLTPHFDERLEEVDQGEWVGRNRHDVHTPEVLAERDRLGFDFAAPGGQSGNQKIAEVLDVFREHVPADGTTVVYTHGLTTRLMIAHSQRWQPEQMSRLEIANASTTGFAWDGHDLRLNYVNETSYLRGIITL